jgi:hypothetical protein
VVGSSDVSDCVVAFCNVGDSVVARFVVGGCVVCGCKVEVGAKSVDVSLDEETVVVSVSLIGEPVRIIVVGGSDVSDCKVAFCNVEDSVVARFVVSGCVVCG